ncbi:outer membrane beta-barrel protein [Adhaeribacter pallidiroseus]|uniref:Outer membrane protein beta-barrel domain-containing protein n=1 Tax=Adhaeribacter pallidiroseus TaxID=2072847 RepID=A0A369QHI7_9BACT|nr:outer membrane beta-barrel protein [Adhaeribacter pallidiroseus]RDC64361.1 hypothetical protein AHMF7616_02974 [Adhaeribacter pallidiroseus]
MKTTFALIFLLFTSVLVWAQQLNPAGDPVKKFYVGVDFNVTPYYLNYNAHQSPPILHGTNFTPYPGIHVGYQVSKRARIQIGAAYATNRYYQQASTRDNNGVLEGNYDAVNTKGLIVPVSFRYDFLDVSKRFRAYGFATLTTVYAHSALKSTATRDGVVLDSYQTKASGVSLSMGLGLGVNYRLNNRFRVFGEYSVVNRNITGGWVPNRRGLDINLLNMGLNYTF